MGPNDVDEVQPADSELSEDDLASVAGGLSGQSVGGSLENVDAPEGIEL